MNISKTSIQDLFVIEPNVFGDDRGYFMETYKESWWKEHFPDIAFVQDNESKSVRGVLRGLHFQTPPYAQSKLVRVIDGKVLDVAVDLRKNSATYGQHESILLSSENKKQFFVPRGFAHGFVVLSETAIFSYKVDNVYAPDHDAGIRWSDPDLAIDWKIDQKEVILSEKDSTLQLLNDFESPFIFK